MLVVGQVLASALCVAGTAVVVLLVVLEVVVVLVLALVPFLLNVWFSGLAGSG